MSGPYTKKGINPYLRILFSVHQSPHLQSPASFASVRGTADVLLSISNTSVSSILHFFEERMPPSRGATERRYIRYATYSQATSRPVCLRSPSKRTTPPSTPQKGRRFLSPALRQDNDRYRLGALHPQAGVLRAPQVPSPRKRSITSAVSNTTQPYHQPLRGKYGHSELTRPDGKRTLGHTLNPFISPRVKFMSPAVAAFLSESKNRRRREPSRKPADVRSRLTKTAQKLRKSQKAKQR